MNSPPMPIRRAHALTHRLVLPIVLISLSLLISSIAGLSAAEASTVLSCDEDHRINARFDNGASWALCWTSTRHENIVLSEIHYQPADQPAIRVISSLRLAQLHVTYDDSEVTYNDVTQFGLGGGYVSTLFESDCPGGELLNIAGRAGLCQQIGPSDTDSHGSATTPPAQTLTLFSISQVGSYAYLVTWKLHDDGSIEPSIGAAGALQRSAEHEKVSEQESTLAHGRVLEGTPGKIWLSHTHNYYWRIDFDIGERAENDVVTEVSYPLDASGRRPQQLERLMHESARKIDADTLTAWYITDDSDDIENAAGYLIEPIHYGHKLVRQAAEPFTEFDLFVTRHSDCERYINENRKFNPECGDDILAYTNHESLQNEDVVVWHRISFHHVPRSEDKRHMHSHWDGFLMQARNLQTGTLPLNDAFLNAAPVVRYVKDQINDVGDAVELQVMADDSDGDTLTFQYEGLPDGLRLTADGLVRGTTSRAGEFRVVLKVSDGLNTTTRHMEWNVRGASTSGSLSALLLVVLASSFICRNSTKKQKNC